MTNRMDLKEQLVIWKRSAYLLEHISLTPQLCSRLVDYQLFTPDMMADVQVISRVTVLLAT